MRFETSPGLYRAMTALLLLGPWTPLLFQGEEFGATSPFVFFTDIGDENLREGDSRGPVRVSHSIPFDRRAGSETDPPGADTPGKF